MLDLPQRVKGKVKFFDIAKGFGFIAPDTGGKDIFVHVSAVQAAGIPHLKENMIVSFELQADTRGRGSQAVVIQLLSLS
jgi:cold shock protein